MKRALLLTLAALAFLPALSTAHDGGGDVTRGHGQIADLTLGTPLPMPVTPPENVSYVTGDNGFTGGHVVTQGDRLYLGSYGRGLHIYDISDPAAPRRIGAYTTGLRADTPPDAIDVGDRRFAVLNGTRRTHSSLPAQARTDRTEWLDVTDPAAPKVLHTFGPDQVDGESHNGDIVDSRRLYVPSGGVGGQGLRIYDISPTVTTPASECRDGDPANPVVINRWLHAQGSGHHPIRYHHEAQFLSSDPRVMLVTDEDLHNGCGGAGGVIAVRLSADLKSSRELSEWFIPFGT